MYFFLEAKGLGCHTKFKILLSEKKLEIFRRKKLLGGKVMKPKVT